MPLFLAGELLTGVPHAPPDDQPVHAFLVSSMRRDRKRNSLQDYCCCLQWHILFIVAIILTWNLCVQNIRINLLIRYIWLYFGVTFSGRILIGVWPLTLQLPWGEVGQPQPLVSRVLKISVCLLGGIIGRWFKFIQCTAIQWHTTQHSTTQHNITRLADMLLCQLYPLAQQGQSLVLSFIFCFLDLLSPYSDNHSFCQIHAADGY